MKESSIHYQVAQYLKNQYPNLIFRTDFAAGIKMTMGQAKKHKSLQSGRSYPDLFIAKSKIDSGSGQFIYCGLYIELKRDGVQLIRSKDATKIAKDDYKLRKKGDWYDLHTEEQANMLGALRKEGYCAEFAVGFNEAVKLIDNYVKK